MTRNKECGVAWNVTSQQHGMWDLVLTGPRGMELEQSRPYLGYTMISRNLPSSICIDLVYWLECFQLQKTEPHTSLSDKDT